MRTVLCATRRDFVRLAGVSAAASADLLYAPAVHRVRNTGVGQALKRDKFVTEEMA